MRHVVKFLIKFYILETVLSPIVQPSLVSQNLSLEDAMSNFVHYKVASILSSPSRYCRITFLFNHFKGIFSDVKAK